MLDPTWTDPFDSTAPCCDGRGCDDCDDEPRCAGCNVRVDGPGYPSADGADVFCRECRDAERDLLAATVEIPALTMAELVHGRAL